MMLQDHFWSLYDYREFVSEKLIQIVDHSGNDCGDTTTLDLSYENNGPCNRENKNRLVVDPENTKVNATVSKINWIAIRGSVALKSKSPPAPSAATNCVAVIIK